MSTKVSYQRYFVTVRLEGVSVAVQRLFVPVLPGFGVEVSYQRLMVPILADKSVEISYQRFFVPILGALGRRRGFMNFSP